MKKIIIMLSAFTLLFTSCDPEEVVEEALDTSTAQDNARLEQEWSALDVTVNQIVINEFSNEQQLKVASKASDCYTITFTSLSSPYKAKVVFNGSACDFDGRTRTGTLDIEFTGRYVDDGTKITTTTTDYVVDGYQLVGKQIVTNEGTQSDGSIKYKVEVENGSVTNSNGVNKASWITSTRYRIWVEGSDTPDNLSDDVYKIYGDATGINRNGDNFSFNVSENDPLEFSYTCFKLTQFPYSGTLTLSPEGKEDRVVNYGDGNCDRKVNVKVGSASFDITF